MLHFAVPFSAGIGALYIYRKDRKTVIQRTDGKQFALFVPVHNVLSALPESDFLSISKGTVVCRRYIKHQQRWHLYHVGWPHFSGTQARHEQPSPFKCRNRAGRNEAPSPEYAGKMQPSGRYAVGILRDRACL